MEIGDEVVAYVNQSRTNTESALMDANAPFATISSAIYALNAYEGQDVDRKVKVIGAYSCATAKEVFDGSAGKWRGFPIHTELMTIESTTPTDSSAAINLDGLCLAGGPVKFDNAYFTVSSSVRLSGADAIFGANAKNTESGAGALAAGMYAAGANGNNSPAATKVQSIVLDGISLKDVNLSHDPSNAQRSADHAGINFVMNGGSISRRLTIGLYSGANGTSYTGDVNVTINGGTVPFIRIYDTVSTFEGVNIQVLLNNGVKLTDSSFDLHINDKVGQGFGDIAVYYVKADKHPNGVTLATTDVAGTYAINGDLGKYVPVVYNAAGAKVAGAYNESAKTITVPIGTYNVKFERLDPIVTHITAPAGATSENYRWTPGASNFYKGGIDEASAYTVSFDYYLPETVSTLLFDSVSGWMTTALSSNAMNKNKGHHTFTWTTFANPKELSTGQFVPYIKLAVGTEMYLWNWSVKQYGAEMTPYNDGYNASKYADMTYGTADQYLYDYSWYPTMDDVMAVSMEIVSAPTKTEYEIGESLNTAGLSLNVTYSDSTTATVTEGFEVSGFDSATAGEKTVTVSYNGFTTTFTVVVVAPSGIAVATGPNKTNYELGDTLDVTGLTINLVYTNGKTEPVTNFTVGTLDSTRGAEKAITVTYGEFTTTFTVTVYEPIVTEIKAPASVTSGTYRWTLGDKNFYKGGVDAATAYTVTFDYFIAETLSEATFASVSGFTSGYVSGSNAMKKYPGHHKFEWTFYIKDANFTTGQFVPYIKLGYGDTMYLWNWSVKQNGVELTPYNGNHNANHNADMTYGTTENGLTTYEWYSYMDDIEPPVPAYHFDFDGQNFDKTTFMDGSNTTYKSLFYATNVSSGAASGTFTLTFDYYLPEAATIYVNCANMTDLHIPDDATGSAYLHQGRHTFKATIDMADISARADNSGSNTIFGFASIYDYWLDVNTDDVKDGAVNGVSILPGDLYIWNFSLKNEDTGEVRATGFTRGFAGTGMGCIADTAFDMNKLEMVNVSDVTLLDYTTAPEYGDEDFGTTGSYGIYYPAKVGIATGNADVEYTISFDYYLPEANKKIDINLSNYTNAEGSSTLRNIAQGETSRYGLEVGRHKFEAKFTSDQISNGLVHLGFIGNCGTNNTLMKVYVWNLSLVCTSGQAAEVARGNYFEGRDFYVYTTNDTSGMRKPTMSNCDFTIEETEPAKELDMVGTQLRSDYALRFVTRLRARISRVCPTVKRTTRTRPSPSVVSPTPSPVRVSSSGVMFV